MSTETRHQERNALYHLKLILAGGQTLEQAESHLLAIMEPEDVELVEKAVSDFMDKKKAR